MSDYCEKCGEKIRSKIKMKCDAEQTKCGLCMDDELNAQKTMKDLRSPLAKARDKWIASEEGQRCVKRYNGILEPQYLLNRVECAFIAGWDAHKRMDDLISRSKGA